MNQPTAICLYESAVLATCEACDKDVSADDICSETGDYRCEICCSCRHCNQPMPGTNPTTNKE